MSFCKHRVMDRCKKDGRPCIYSKDCFESEEPKPMTNADRIRAMTDEELADWLEAWCRDAESCYDCPMDVCPIEESVSWLNWLQQPVKEGAE